MIAADDTAPDQEFTEISAIDPGTGRTLMYLRIAQTDPGDESTGPLPDLSLAVGAGEFVALPPAAPVPVPGGPAGSTVAVASRSVASDRVVLVVLELFEPGQAWRLRIHNPHPTRVRRYTWVVADSGEQTEQPWIDVQSDPLAFHTTAGVTALAEAVIGNAGPGTLTLTEQPGTTYGAEFVLLAVSPTQVPPGGRARARVAYSPPVAAPPIIITHDVASDDLTPGHRRTLTLTGDAKPHPLWDFGDVLLLGADGALWVVRPADGATTVAAHGPFGGGVSVLPGGDAVVLGAAPDGNGYRLLRVDRFTGAPSAIPLASPPLDHPHRPLVDQDGHLLVVDGQETALVRVNPTTGDRTPVAAQFRRILDVCLYANGHILVIDDVFDYDGGQIVWVDPFHGGAKYFGPRLPLDRTATSVIAIEPAGTVAYPGWVYGNIDGMYTYSDGYVTRLNPVNGSSSTLGSWSGTHLTAIDVDQHGRLLVLGPGLSVYDPPTGWRTLSPTASGISIAAVPDLGA
jgi:hypothetical protein